jgi:hypothetical protein
MKPGKRRRAVIVFWLVVNLSAGTTVLVQILPLPQQQSSGSQAVQHTRTAPSWSQPFQNPAFEPLPAGHAAADFTLPSVADGSPVRLADFRRSKPVALIFSSFT